MLVWINGDFVPREEASTSIFDAGLQHGVGLFETVAARNGRIFRGFEHMDRLAQSARELRLTERLNAEPLVAAMQLTIERNGMTDARVRLTVTGGDLNMLASTGRGPSDPSIIIVAQPPTPYPDDLFETGVATVIADARVNPLDPTAGHKTLNYWMRIQSLQEAASRQAGEALWFSVTNHLTGGSVSNMFLVKDDRLLTPTARGEEEQGALATGVLPGVTRACIIECAETEGLTVERRLLTIDDALAADEVFLTNSSWGVLPVIRLEREDIGTGEVGNVARALRRRLLDMIERETTQTH